MSAAAIAIFERIFRRNPSEDERTEMARWPEIDPYVLAYCFELQAMAGREHLWSVAAALQRRGLLPMEVDA